ncbi:MAG: MerR family transcriptional regulator [Myxococcota bacterium]
MKNWRTIGELARAADVPTSTVRYYEREGILKPSGRSSAGYRRYTDEDLQRLRFIRAAQATGFTLQDIRTLLRPASCSRVQRLIEGRLAVVQARLRELRHLQRVLGAALEACRAHESSGRCRVIADLSESASGRSS